mmetsp:Transcript_66177/g.149399  ORF Transcript_66177/g.149399 Transcript_66177/m.149399 type:complete len:285 (+) Transcript_66177:203-1057(+)
MRSAQPRVGRALASAAPRARAAARARRARRARPRAGTGSWGAGTTAARRRPVRWRPSSRRAPSRRGNGAAKACARTPSRITTRQPRAWWERRWRRSSTRRRRRRTRRRARRAPELASGPWARPKARLRAGFGAGGGSSRFRATPPLGRAGHPEPPRVVGRPLRSPTRGSPPGTWPMSSPARKCARVKPERRSWSGTGRPTPTTGTCAATSTRAASSARTTCRASRWARPSPTAPPPPTRADSKPPKPPAAKHPLLLHQAGVGAGPKAGCTRRAGRPGPTRSWLS